MYILYHIFFKKSNKDFLNLAGAQGLEPQYAVLETAVLPLNDTPICLSLSLCIYYIINFYKNQIFNFDEQLI